MAKASRSGKALEASTGRSPRRCPQPEEDARQVLPRARLSPACLSGITTCLAILPSGSYVGRSLPATSKWDSEDRKLHAVCFLSMLQSLQSVITHLKRIDLGSAEDLRSRHRK